MSSKVIRIVAAALAMAGVAACTTGLLVRWPISDPALRAEILSAIERSSGLAAEAEGPISLVLLPRPSVRLGSMHLEAAGRAVTVDADAVTGTLSMTALLRGVSRIVSATLTDPTITVDLDRVLPTLRASLPRDAPLADGPEPAVLSFFRTDGLTLRSGVLRLKSADPLLDTVLTDITAAWEWPAGDTGPSLAGRMTWHGNPMDVAAFMEAPGALVHGGTTQANLRIRSPNLDLTADGTLSGRAETPSSGTLLASTPSLPAFLRLIGTPLLPLDGISEARIGGDMTFLNKSLAISGVRLTLDDMLFEGALAVHDDNGHPGVAGTLATDQIDLEPFVRMLPAPFAPDGAWSRSPLQTDRVAYDDIDLRVSASRAHMGRIVFEDSGLSLQSGGGRMEISLGEARAYDGLFKGRVVAQVAGGRTDVRADATFSQLNLGALAADLGTGQQASGTSTGHATLEGTGDSPAELIASLAGHGQVSVRDGAVGPGLLESLVTDADAAGGPTLPSAPLSFDAALVGLDVAAGVASLGEGWVLRPDLRVAFGGSADLAAQRVNLRGAITRIEGDVPAQAGRPATLALMGPWRAPRLSYAEEAPGIEAAPPATR